MLVKEAKKPNPFKSVGLVIKYEFLNAARKFVPLYIVLIIMGLVAGLLNNPMGDELNKLQTQTEIQMDENIDAYSLQLEMRENDFKRGIIYTILYFLVAVYTIIIVCLTIITLSKRFKKSMLQDEAYLNLVLPVSIGQHLWGRFLNALIWLIICFVIIAVSGSFYLIRNNGIEYFKDLIDIFKQGNGFSKLNCTVAQFFILLIAQMFMMGLTIILSTYFVNSLGHLFPKARTFVKLLAVILCIYLFFKLPGITAEIFNLKEYIPVMLSMIGTYAFMCIVYFVTTYLVFEKRLNLE